MTQKVSKQLTVGALKKFLRPLDNNTPVWLESESGSEELHMAVSLENIGVVSFVGENTALIVDEEDLAGASIVGDPSLLLLESDALSGAANDPETDESEANAMIVPPEIKEIFDRAVKEERESCETDASLRTADGQCLR